MNSPHIKKNWHSPHLQQISISSETHAKPIGSPGGGGGGGSGDKKKQTNAEQPNANQGMS